MTDFPDLKFKALVNFPASAIGGTGIDIRKQNGNFYVDLHYSEFAKVASLPPADIPNSYVLAFNDLTGVYTLVPPDSIAGFLPLTGGTLTGPLKISLADPALSLYKAPGVHANLITGGTGASPRWIFLLGNYNAESGANVGSDFALYRYSDAGVFIDAPISIARNTGRLLLTSDPTNALEAATKQYVDTHGGGGALPQPQGRLTLTTGVAIPESDVLSSPNIFLTPCVNDSTAIYDGVSFVSRQFAETTLALTGAHLSGKCYDIFDYWTGSAVNIGTGPAWAANTSRGTGAGSTEVEMFHGVLVNKNSITLTNGAGGSVVAARQATLRGAFWCQANGLVNDTAALRCLSNVYNVTPRPLLKLSSGTWTYTTDAFVIGGNGTLFATVMNAVGGRMIDVEVSGVTTATIGGVRPYMGIGLDGLIDIAQQVRMNLVASTSDIGFARSAWRGFAGLGTHTISGLERVTSASGTVTWYASGAGYLSGLSGSFLA